MYNAVCYKPWEMVCKITHHLVSLVATLSVQKLCTKGRYKKYRLASNVHAICEFGSQQCTCHLSVWQLAMYMPFVSWVATNVHAICLFGSQQCTCHLSVWQLAMYMPFVSLVASNAHAICQFGSQQCTCHLSVWQPAMYVPFAHSTYFS